MGIKTELKEFLFRGNVVDMAVGVVVGAAFGKIVTSFVNDILMPPLSMLLLNTNFTNLKIVLREAVSQGSEIVKPEVSLNYGNFIQVILDFLIISISIFFVIKGIYALKKKPDSKPAAPDSKEVLLSEIRDLLKNK